MDINELFLRATREKFRFFSPIGELTVESLWDIPLTSGKKTNLDDVAKTVNTELKATVEESFVSTGTNPKRSLLEAKLELVKAIIAIRMAENEAFKARVAKTERRRQIEQAIADSDARNLSSASKDDLLKMLKELD